MKIVKIWKAEVNCCRLKQTDWGTMNQGQMQESMETTHAELEERLRFETLLAETSSRFINVPADNVDPDL
jgi:hypothetical protein